MRKDITNLKREPTESQGRKDFELFQKEFQKWQLKLGLTGYKVYFSYEPLESSFANISINQEEMVATVRLNSGLPDKDKPHKDVRQSGKHEALHLLAGRLEALARSRYTCASEVNEAVEELVIRFEVLIN